MEVLGPLRITARGQEIRGGLRKARELAAFLAVHPDGVTGEAISEALWPEAAPGHGASQRNLALRKLRDLLRAAAGLTEPMLVTLTAGRYRLDPAFITTDVADFQAALHRARQAGHDGARLAACQEAAALYRGPLAEGAGYDWAEPYAETARRRALDAWTPSPRSSSPATPSRRWPHWKPRSATTRSTSTSTSGSCACRPRPAAPTRSAARCACWKQGSPRSASRPAPRPARPPPRSWACPGRRRDNNAAAARSRPPRRAPPRLPASARPAATPPGDPAPPRPAAAPRPARRLETTARAALPSPCRRARNSRPGSLLPSCGYQAAERAGRRSCRGSVPPANPYSIRGTC